MSDNDNSAANRLAAIYLTSLRRRLATTKKLDEWLREETLSFLDNDNYPVDARVSLALSILRKLGIHCPVKAEIVSGAEVGHPEHPEWLKMTYASQRGEKSKTRSAKTDDVRRGRFATYIPRANRKH